MSNPLKRPPLPQKKKNVALRRTVQSQTEHLKDCRSKIVSSNIVELKEEVIRKNGSSIRTLNFQSKPNHLGLNHYQSIQSSGPQRTQKRGLLKEWSQIQKESDCNKATNHFISSFNSIPNKSIRPKRIIRIRSQRSIQRALFEPAKAIEPYQKLQILKEENQFYRRVSRESKERLSSLEKQLERSKSDFQSQKQEWKRKIRRLSRQAEYKQSFPLSSQKSKKSKAYQRSKLVSPIQ